MKEVITFVPIVTAIFGVASEQSVAQITLSSIAVVPDKVISDATPAVIVVGLIALMIESLVPAGAACAITMLTLTTTHHRLASIEIWTPFRI